MNTLFCLFAFFSFHEFYVSTSYMEYNDKKQSIQVQKKIFFDDFEIALRKFTGDEYFDIIKSNEDKINLYINNYLIENLNIKVNGKSFELKYLGHEYKNGVINCFFEYSKIKKISSLEIKDLSLISNFEGQENLIYFEKDNKLSTLRITESNLSAEIKF